MPTAVANPEECPECGHDAHAGRCFVVSESAGRPTYCPCKHRRPVGSDQPLGFDSWRT